MLLVWFAGSIKPRDQIYSFPFPVIHRCLVGDPSGKSYGDVAFLEQSNLEANILSRILKMKYYMNIPVEKY